MTTLDGWQRHTCSTGNACWLATVNVSKKKKKDSVVSVCNEWQLCQALLFPGLKQELLFNGWPGYSHQAFSCGTSLSALKVATFQTNHSSTVCGKRCYYIRSFPAASVVLSVTQLPVSDHSSHESGARGRDFFNEIFWELDHKMQKCATMMFDISVH